MKIDVTKLEGYRADMTADEKLALIEKYDIPDPDYTGYIKKDTFDRTASELAEAKRQLKAKLTEDEQKEADRLKAEGDMKAELETLRKETAVSRHKADFIGLGYDEKLAEDTARALVDGDMKKVFANQKVHQDALAKAAKAAALAGGDPPPPGKNDPPVPERNKLQKQYDEAVKTGNTALAVSLKN